MRAANRNLLWAKIFVEELAHAGVRDVVIAPGSRSTPLVFAFAEHGAYAIHSLIDERGAAFFALGLANATERPVALVCTSGSAPAHFFPAVIEAHYSGIPLIILTADRSPELRDSGANQTVDQVKLFGDHAVWFYEVALPESQPPAVALRNLRTLAHRAVLAAMGFPRGVVHLNFPFRKPLEPTVVDADLHDVTSTREGRAYVSMQRGTLNLEAAEIESLAKNLRQAQRGVIVCGPRCPGGGFPDAVRLLSKVSGFPILADALSGVRYGPDQGATLLDGYESFLPTLEAGEAPDCVIQFGAQPVSQALETFLEARPPERWLLVSDNGNWQEPGFFASDYVWADPEQVCVALTNVFNATPPQAEVPWRQRLAAMNEAVRLLTKEFCANQWFDGAVLAYITSALPDGAPLYVASSLAVRHLDQFSIGRQRQLHAFANRGASGIDGTLATAFGVGKAFPEHKITVVLGDLALYHDLNSLLALQRCGVEAVIVVINNDGGGIFERLPVAAFDPPFTELFLTPHGLHFEKAAAQFGIAYTRASNHETFANSFARAHEITGSTLIEVPSAAKHDLHIRQLLLERTREQVTQMLWNPEGVKAG